MGAAVFYQNETLTITVNWSDATLTIQTVSWVNNGPDATLWVKGASRVLTAGSSGSQNVTGNAKMIADGSDFHMDASVPLRVGP